MALFLTLALGFQVFPYICRGFVQPKGPKLKDLGWKEAAAGSCPQGPFSRIVNWIGDVAWECLQD